MEIQNKVAQSGIETLDLSPFLPQTPAIPLDLKDFLVMGLVLREKDFRQQLKSHDWSVYQDKTVAVFCSVDTLIPKWAYMLIAANLQDIAADVFVGAPDLALSRALQTALNNFNWSAYEDKIIVLKGCGNNVPPDAYLQATRYLQPYAKKIMYGEPCSAVPVWRKSVPAASPSL